MRRDVGGEADDITDAVFRCQQNVQRKRNRSPMHWGSELRCQRLHKFMLWQKVGSAPFSFGGTVPFTGTVDGMERRPPIGAAIDAGLFSWLIDR